jgi:hypothetical protein
VEVCNLVDLYEHSLQTATRAARWEKEKKKEDEKEEEKPRPGTAQMQRPWSALSSMMSERC